MTAPDTPWDIPPLLNGELAPMTPDPRRSAKLLFWLGWRPVDIADALGLPEPTIRSWKARDKWEEAPCIERMEGAIEVRFIALILKSQKSGQDFKEIDLLSRMIERLARVRRYELPGGHEGDLNQKVGDRNRAAAKKRPVANTFTDAQIAEAQRIFETSQFAYQGLWYSESAQRTRMILKSRQTGATFYFAREALIDALTTGRNQVFLSASKNQANVFRQYILQLAAEVGVELRGDPIVLPNGATFYFLGTNARTAQGYHGNFYFDEFFWTFRFQELNKVAQAMATHKHWRKTYFSTPSSIQHEAYPFWSGELFNKRRPKEQRAAFDLSHDALKGGKVGADRIWRNILTIHDAAAGGMDMFDVEELQLENNPADFANLYLCQFIDDTLSVFPLSMLQPCMVDAWEEWTDVDWLAMDLGGRPFGQRPVWVGYDPSRSGDRASLIVVAPPGRPGGKFRVLEKQRFQGADFASQAAAIKKITERYNVEYIGIDHNGLGIAVYDLVVNFFPAAKKIAYTPEGKGVMVHKTTDVIRSHRLQFDAGETELAASLMQIRKTLTASQRQVTYEAGRDEETGHADLAMSLMHVLINEPLSAPHHAAGGGNILEIYD